MNRLKKLKTTQVFRIKFLLVLLLLGVSSLATSPVMVSGSVNLNDVGIPDFFVRSNITIYIPDDVGSAVAFMNPDLSYRKVGNQWAITGVAEAQASEIHPSASTDEERNVYVVPPDEDIVNENGEWGLQKFGGERTYLNKTLGLGNDDYSSANLTYVYDSSVNVTGYPYLVLTNMRSVSTTSNTTITLKYANGTDTGAGIWANKTGVTVIFNDFDANARDRWWKLNEHVDDQTPFYGVNITVTNVALDSFLLFKSEDPITDSRYTPFYFGSSGSSIEGVTPSISPDLELIQASNLASPVNQRPVGMSSSEWLDSVETSEFLSAGASDIELEKFEDQRTFGWETTKNMEWDVLAEMARIVGLTVDELLEGTQQYPSVIDDYEIHWTRSKFSIDGETSRYLYEIMRQEADSSRSLETVIDNVKADSITSVAVLVGTGGAGSINDIVDGSFVMDDVIAYGEGILAAIFRGSGSATSIEGDVTETAGDTTAKMKFDNMINTIYSGLSSFIQESLGDDISIAGMTTVLALMFVFAIVGVVVAIIFLIKGGKALKKRIK